MAYMPFLEPLTKTAKFIDKYVPLAKDHPNLFYGGLGFIAGYSAVRLAGKAYSKLANYVLILFLIISY